MLMFNLNASFIKFLHFLKQNKKGLFSNPQFFFSWTSDTKVQPTMCMIFLIDFCWLPCTLKIFQLTVIIMPLYSEIGVKQYTMSF